MYDIEQKELLLEIDNLSKPCHAITTLAQHLFTCGSHP